MLAGINAPIGAHIDPQVERRTGGGGKVLPAINAIPGRFQDLLWLAEHEIAESLNDLGYLGDPRVLPEQFMEYPSFSSRGGTALQRSRKIVAVFF